MHVLTNIQKSVISYSVILTTSILIISTPIEIEIKDATDIASSVSYFEIDIE